MAKFVCQAGPDAGHEYPITEARTVFGRRSGCQVQIMDSMASREHFEVRKVGQLYTLIDLESRNGTKVNDRKVTERQLEFNDRVRVGEVEWMFVKEEGDVELKDLLTSKYEVVEKVGEGGMGVVYKALQRSMDRTVALKVLAPKYAARPKFVQRFIDEARAAGRLNHPNIIQVHDVDTENGIHYFSMEFIDGGTCAQLLKANGPFPPDQALEITRLTAKALQYAHENRLIHRDVKPDNIMVSSSNMVKLADLGISKSFDEAEAEERPKKIIGTPHYMAPEAIQGKRIDHRVDIYSLGATLYHLLTGQTPYSGKSATSVLRSHVNDAPKPLAELRPELPDRLCQLVEHMMAKDPESRHATMTDLISAVEAVQKACGFGSDLPSTGDTVMLRRFATGSGSGSRSRSGSAERDQSGSATGSATAGRSGEGDVDAMDLGALLRWAAVVVVLILGGLLAFNLINSLDRDADDPDANSDNGTDTTRNAPGLGEGQQGTPPGDDSEDPAQSPTERLRIQQHSALRRLRERLEARPEDQVLREIDRELSAIEDDPADRTIADICVELRSELDRLIAERLAEAATERLRTLREEVARLREEHDYDAALKRLQGFDTQGNTDTDRVISGMINAVRVDRDSFLSTLSTRIDRAIRREDAETLRQIRDQELPRSMVGSDLADRITQALRQMDQEQLAAHRAHIQDLTAKLAMWDMDGYQELREELADELASGPEAQRFEDLDNLASSVQAWLKEMETEINDNQLWPRYPGLIGGVRNADVTEIDNSALIMRPAGGGDAKVMLRNLDAETIKTVTRLTLGEVGHQAYAPVIDRVIALRE